MNGRLGVLFSLALVTAAQLLPAQDQLPGSDFFSDPQQQQQPSSALCPDGSTPDLGADGSSCPNRGQNSSIDTTGLGGQRNLPASPGEDSSVQNGVRRTMQPLTPPEPLTEFQKFVAETSGSLLPVYGSNLFRTVPSTFAPSNLAPASADYVLGTDDEVRIRIWGQINYSGNLRVNRSGDIYIPQVGTVHVAGLQFAELDGRLRQAVSRIYKNFDLSVDMGRIRSIQVYLTGHARHPGAYTVSSLSTLVNALFASGGPAADGSLRHIQLRRNGQTVTDFDLYDLLVKGDKSHDARLMPEDVIYIPAVGPQVAITGSVHAPAIYELIASETIGDLLNIAGKTTSIASSMRISIDRVSDQEGRQAVEVALDTAGLSTPLSGGDILRVYPIKPAYRNTVVLRGNVANPGRFAWHVGMKLSDLIPDKDSLLSRDYWWKRSHLGLPSPEFEPFMSKVDPNRERLIRSTVTPYANGSASGPAGDNYGSAQNAPYGVTREYSIDHDPYTPYQDMTGPAAQDLLAAGLNAANQAGAQPNGSALGRGHATREGGEARDPGNSGYGSASGSLGSSLEEGSSGYQNPWRVPKTDVRVSTSEIYWQHAVIERTDPELLKTSLIPFDLGKLVVNHDASQDLPLQPGDVITIFSQNDIRVPLEQQTKYVHLEGEFVHAGVYSVQPGETLKDLVRRAGGLTPKAYLYGSEFDRESTRVLQQERIDEYVQRVDLDAGRGAVAVTTSATTSMGSSANAAAATAAERDLIARLKQIRATGRIVLNFTTTEAKEDDVPAIPLENGDRFIVPPVPATVNVVGAVYDQNSFVYHPTGDVGRYLAMAGGPDRDADWRRTFVVRANGSVVARKSVKGVWGNTFSQLRVNPGDTIIVPDKNLRPTALRGLLDWTQIFSQLAIGAAAVNVLR